MSNFSVPIAVTDQVSKHGQSGAALPAIVGLLMISISVIVVLILWISVVDDPGGGQPRISVEIQTDTSGLDLGTIGVANVRPSITPDPEDISVEVEPETSNASAAIRKTTDMPAPSQPPTADETQSTATAATDPMVEDSDPIAVSTHKDAQRLTVFPLDNMVARGEFGLIPKRSSDGQTPFTTYARPQQFVPEGPKIALIIGGVGLSQRTTSDALSNLPPTIALAFASYSDNLERWKKMSRESGFELLIEAPMEPFNYPQNDPGPHTLLVDATAAENRSKLEWILSRTSNYIGLIPSMGARFTSNENALLQLGTELNQMGLAFIDPSNSVRSIANQVIPRVSTNQLGHLPFLKVDVVLDSDASRVTLQQNLIQLEEFSNSKGLAVGYMQLRPATVETLQEWLQLLEQRGVTLIPLSAAINLSMPKL